MGVTRQPGRAILLIEDDPDIGDLIVELLRDEGYETTVAATPAASVGLLAAQRFDLVLSDAFAENEFAANRWGTLERIRRAAGAVPVIICTAHRADQFAGYAARGFAALLEKPFDLDDLLALLARLIDEQQRPAMPPRSDPPKG